MNTVAEEVGQKVIPTSQGTTTTVEGKTYTRLSLEDFKRANNISTIEVVRNPKAPGGLFVSTSAGRFNCQQDIDFTKPVEFMQVDENGTKSAWCLVQRGSNNVVATF